ncbi:AAA family ATPase [Aeromonas hydrophila]|uniref:AAA family ATPase n=1 Tax=Aeromonas hydrophila TaxID=644 RepID=UPI0038D00402
MKIQRITTEKLFGIFDHDIPLNEDGNITIVIGENGLGKTVILEAVSSFFSEQYQFFTELEFESFLFHFDNNEVWRLTKKKNNISCDLFIARAEKSEKDATKLIFKEHKISSTYISPQNLRMREMERRRRVEMELEFEYDILRKNSINEMDIDYLNYKRSLLRRRGLDSHHMEESVKKPKWFTDSIKKINIQLIETQRVITAKEIGSDEYVSNIRKCSTELKKMISLAVKESSSVTSKLDSTYPNRLITKLRQGTKDTFDELNKALLNLDERRKLFSSIGLVVDIGNSDILQIKESQNDLINILKLYIDDSHAKLDPFEELSKKLDLFIGIINKRFKHKKLEISHEEGFIFKSKIKKDKSGLLEAISPSKLSSGEQNEIILFYKLIFNSKPGDMIFIDEPELSLHISWQNKFIKDLKDVTSMNNVSILIATHSPDIIADNWDLKVELSGLE